MQLVSIFCAAIHFLRSTQCSVKSMGRVVITCDSALIITFFFLCQNPLLIRHKAVIDGILAIPPTPNPELAPDVSEFIKRFAVPEDLSPFDIGVGGRQILRVDPVVWISPDGPKPGRLLRHAMAKNISCCVVELLSLKRSVVSLSTAMLCDAMLINRGCVVLWHS